MALLYRVFEPNGMCDLEHDFLRVDLYNSSVKLPFRPNWLLRLFALVAITVSGGALANQYFLRLEQAPKLAKQHDKKQLPTKPTAALFEQKKLEHPVFADLDSRTTSVFIPKPKLEFQIFTLKNTIFAPTVSYRAEVSRAPPIA
jgi:hypothetical protein